MRIGRHCGMYLDSGKTNACRSVTEMTDSISYRGPDDEGVWQEGRVTLGHRRFRSSTCPSWDTSQ